jgi:hypothetical protein
LVSPGTRFVASEANATYRPFALITGLALSPLPGRPLLDTLTRVVTPRRTSRTKMSKNSLVSPGTRASRLTKATYRPFGVIAPSQAWRTPPPTAGLATLTGMVRGPPRQGTLLPLLPAV